MSLDAMKMIIHMYNQSCLSALSFGAILTLMAAFLEFKKNNKNYYKCWSKDSCRQSYKQLQILPLPSLYIFSFLVYVNKTRSLFLSNSAIRDRNTRYNDGLYLPSTNLTSVQKGVLYSGSNIYYHLPLNIKMLSEDAKQFKSKLRSCLT